MRDVDWITLSQNRDRLAALGNVEEIRDFEFQFGIFINSFAFPSSCLCLMHSIKHKKISSLIISEIQNNGNNQN